MTDKLSEKLVNISTMMMVAQERGEIVHLAGELVTLVENAMELERLTSCALPSQKKATLSTSIKFTTKEIETMSNYLKRNSITLSVLPAKTTDLLLKTSFPFGSITTYFTTQTTMIRSWRSPRPTLSVARWKGFPCGST